MKMKLIIALRIIQCPAAPRAKKIICKIYTFSFTVNEGT